MMEIPEHSSSEALDNAKQMAELRQESEFSRSSTQKSIKCKNCGAMFDTSEHAKAGAFVCPVCGHREGISAKKLQSSDEGF